MSKVKNQTSPTIDNPDITTKPEETTDALTMNALNKEVGAKSETLQAIGSISKGALKQITGLIANVAGYGSTQRVDFDENGNQVLDGPEYHKQRYRSTQNLSENEDIKRAIESQRAELKAAQKIDKMTFTLFTEEDLLRVIEETNDVLQRRIFGPLWKNWTTGEDFLVAIKYALEEILNTVDPLMKIVDELQEYINESTAGLENVEITVNKNSKRDTSLPLGLIAIQALNQIVDYIRNLIKNIEMLAEEYTTEEINALVQKGTSGANWGTAVKALQDLIQLIIDCIKPYIHNIVMALILDAIDIIVDKLDKAGILSPQGPLKLVPLAITLVRAILRGDLEAIEEMIKKTLIKMVNILQLAFVATTEDPSILWADIDRMDKEIAVARYDLLTDDGKKKLDAEGKDKLLNNTTANYSAAFRHFFQKMASETQETFNQAADLATTYTDLTIMYKNATAANKEIKKNKQLAEQKLRKSSARKNAYKKAKAKEIKEKNYP